MASALISNSHHVDFDSVFGMDDATITQMYELLIATGLKDFLGCPAVYYEAALIEFFENGSIREDRMVVSTIRGINVEISEGMFATAFGLPTEGVNYMSDVPKDMVFDARSLFYESEEQPWTATASKIIDLLSVAHSKSLEDLIAQQKEQGIPIEQPCTSTSLDTSKVDTQSIQEFESASSDGSTVYRHCCSCSYHLSTRIFYCLPDITEAIHQLRTSLDQISNQDNGAALKDVILLHLHDIEKKFTTRFDAQDRWFGTLCKDSNDQRNLLSLEIKSSQRQINTQIAAATLDQIDMQSEVKELNAKVDAMATNLEILRRNAEATKEAISHQLLEFQEKIAADILSLSIQIGELVDHIRGGDAKKGEIWSSSHRPLPAPVNQGESISGHGRVISVEEAAEMVREADRQADRREREREREKRLRRLRRRGH
ncbi:protein transport protein sec31-like [Dorcoceras hygrometricum]|uniref:Protein transport protein sec31-like n=1 Tax=Dorcoceras hygrometricum TaxID=472368 RepID=A0A2Z7AFE6_9LAMI|nr:protein transport protein sec31-like [Dorcoceras hygrometricum]